MLDKAIVSIMCIIFLIMIFISMMGMMLTFVQKIDFDQTCRTALYEMDLSGGLTDVKRQELYTILTDNGFQNVSIAAPAEVQYGSIINLRVFATRRVGMINYLLQREEKTIDFKYDRSIVSRKIHNMAY
ncbi:MAG: hypothetical protein ACYCYI_10930 [Saccharofermentanales bacterium]